jgi:methyltransferase (TIGR00027 family)
MRQGEASRTAESIAVYRMLDLLLNPEPIIRDPWARDMIKPSYRFLAGNRLARRFMQRFVFDVRPHVVTSSARSRIAEDRLADKAQRGAVQWVLLGAGLDMFAWRHPEHSAIPQFELDHPSTQDHKRTLVDKLGLKPPALHRFVPIDFEKTRPSEALVGAGFDRSVPAVFAWLGVTFYLTREAILATLTDVASIAAPGSLVVCDYRLPDQHANARDRKFMRRSDPVLVRWGEPHISKLELADWKQLASSTGWSILADDGEQEIAARFPRLAGGMQPASNYRVLTLMREP